MQKKTFFIAWALFVIAVIAAVAYIATTKLRIQDFGKDEVQTATPSPTSVPNQKSSPTPSSEKSDTKTFKHPVLGYSFSYPSDWTLTMANNSNQDVYAGVDVKTSDFKLSDGYPVLNSGYQISVNAAKTDTTSIEKYFEDDPIASKIATNKKSLKVAGSDAIQYDISYEGTIATVTIFIRNGIYYQILYRYADTNLKDNQWSTYGALLSSFKTED